MLYQDGQLDLGNVRNVRFVTGQYNRRYKLRRNMLRPSSRCNKEIQFPSRTTNQTTTYHIS